MMVDAMAIESCESHSGAAQRGPPVSAGRQPGDHGGPLFVWRAESGTLELFSLIDRSRQDHGHPQNAERHRVWGDR